MSPDRLREFLSAGTRTAKLATVRKDGRPHVLPVWFVLDRSTGGAGGAPDVIFMTGADTLKGKALRRDPRACLCVDDEQPPFAFAMVEGTVALSEDLDEMLGWSVRIAERYMGAPLAEQYGRRNAVAGELLVRLTPDNVFAVEEVAD